MSTDGNLIVICSHCGKQMRLPSRFAGKRGKCPSCGGVIDVPGFAPTAPTSVAPAAQRAAAAPVTPQATAAPAVPRAAPAPARARPAPARPAPFPRDVPTVAPAAPANNDSPFGIQAESPTKRAKRSAATSARGGAFAPEKAGLDAGVLGGMAMMAIGAVWFIGGLAAGYIFYYAPILFVIGVVGFIKGLATGNVAGKKRRRRRF